jgi:hypothetical protein
MCTLTHGPRHTPRRRQRLRKSEHMARIAVITAPDIGYRNTGMLTVDMAF